MATLKRGSVTKKVRDAINAGSGTTADDISDASAIGKTVLKAANAGAVRTALSVAEKVSAPANASATGTAGQWATDTGYVYVCTATNTWKRVAIATW